LDAFKIFIWFILIVVALFPVFLVGLAVYRLVYRQWRIWQADQVTLEEKMLIRLQLDSHALGGYVFDLRTREFTDLDTGEHVAKQKIIAALTGASGYSAVAQQVVDENAPMVELPAMMPMPEPRSREGMDL